MKLRVRCGVVSLRIDVHDSAALREVVLAQLQVRCRALSTSAAT
jgi:hypothetical protein